MIRQGVLGQTRHANVQQYVGTCYTVVQFLLVVNNSCHGDATADKVYCSALEYLPHYPDTTKFGLGCIVSSPTLCNKGGALDVRDLMILPLL